MCDRMSWGTLSWVTYGGEKQAAGGFVTPAA